MEKSIYKVVLLGEPGVGKTSLIFRYVNDRFEENYKPTLGFDISIKNIVFKKREYSLTLWDIAGTEQFESLRSSYLDGAQAAILIYDVTRIDTFKNLLFWYKTCRHITGDIPVLLVGNKNDLIVEKKITKDIAKKNMEKLNAYKFYETSAKTGEKVEEMFEEISKKIYQTYSQLYNY